jgi:hypothetical protein
MCPTFVYYSNSIWENCYSKYFGMGYRKLTNNMRKHPKHTFISSLQMISLLRGNKAEVATNPKPTDEIIDTITYQTYLNTKS